MHCRISTPKGIKFRSKLGFNQINITLTKEQSVLIPIKDTFNGENMQVQHSILSNRTDLDLPHYNFTVEVDEKDHNDRDIDCEIKKQGTIEKERSCEFIRIKPDKKNFNIFEANNEIFRHIKESVKKSTEESTIKSLILRNFKRAIRIRVQKNISIKTKCLKYIVKKILLTI